MASAERHAVAILNQSFANELAEHFGNPRREFGHKFDCWRQPFLSPSPGLSMTGPYSPARDARCRDARGNAQSKSNDARAFLLPSTGRRWPKAGRGVVTPTASVHTHQLFLSPLALSPLTPALSPLRGEGE